MPKLIILQEGADLDALSSAYGLMLLYEDTFLLKPEHVSKRASEALKHFAHKLRIVEKPPESFELILVDGADFREHVEKYGKRIKGLYIYDHHPRRMEGFRGRVEGVGSCTTLIVEELMEKGMEIDPESATFLALGIYEDTGMLTYEGTTPRDVRAVAWLMERGLNLKTLRNILSLGISKEELDTLSEHLISLETIFFDGKKVTLLVLRMEDYLPDVLSLVYELRDVKDASAFFVIVEAGNKTYLFGRSIRNEFDVSQLLNKFGGGGHEFASACKLEGVSGERVKSILVALLRGERVPLLVSDVMSYPPFVLSSDTDLKTALFELSQRNYAGAPVLDEEGQLVGVVYKKNLLRAQKHGMNGKVRDFMVEEFHTLRKEDFIWHAEEVLSRYGEKLIPVVEKGQLVGVVTRMDLLSSLHRHMQDAKASEKKLSLPEPIKGILEAIGREAAQMGFRAFLVGGVVRDLLMRKSIWDLDFVVEGKAPELAQRLAQLWGVQAHVFEEFGTAHLKVDKFKIELASTRRETYPYPGSYPVVEWATLKEDLLRRDFTINAIALSINPEDFGTLIDFFGGLRDLKDGILRVLHPMSFVEDPVRILRALRFAGRFGFRLSKGTEKLLKNALSLELLKRAARGRVLNEVRLALREDRLLDIIRLYRKYKIFEQILEGFVFKPELEELLERFRQVQSWHSIEFPEERIDYGWVALLILIKDLKDGHTFLKEISAPSWVRETYRLMKQEMESLLSALRQTSKNSQVYTLLKGKPVPFLLMLMLFEEQKVRIYMERLRRVRVDISDLKGLSGKELGRAIEEKKLRLMDSTPLIGS